MLTEVHIHYRAKSQIIAIGIVLLAILAALSISTITKQGPKKFSNPESVETEPTKENLKSNIPRRPYPPVIPPINQKRFYK